MGFAVRVFIWSWARLACAALILSVSAGAQTIVPAGDPQSSQAQAPDIQAQPAQAAPPEVQEPQPRPRRLMIFEGYV